MSSRRSPAAREPQSLEPEHARKRALWMVRVLLAGLAHRQGPKPLEDLSLGAVALIGQLPRRLCQLAHPERPLRERLLRLEEAGPARGGPLFRNVGLLGDALGLDEVERDLLAMAAMVATDDAVSEAFAVFQPLSRRGICVLLGAAIGADPDRVQRALGQEATLAQTGLVTRGGFEPCESVLQLMEALSTAMLDEHEDVDRLMSRLFKRAPSASLDSGDYPHVARDVALLKRMLEAALHNRAPGFNVLVHGPPGTGKTELGRLLAREVHAELYEVNVTDSDGDPADRHERLVAFNLCQRMLARKARTLVLFDEIEDVFPDDGGFAVLFGRRSRQRTTKGWMNRTLETHPVPTIWVSNDIASMDRAYLRRFDAIVELRTPPRDVRRRILDTHLRDLPVGAEWRERTAADERIAPAYVERSARAVRMTAPASAEEAEASLSRLLHAHADLVGPPPRTSRAAVGTYDLGAVNASHDLDALVTSLRQRPSATLCLYGPPGTGKTAFVAHLAERLGRPLAARRASDLLSMYVGGTEENLARAFRTARDDRAVLFLDEADSFLQDRSRAQRTWEVTQVNELLTQMEAFDGVFVCATNLVDTLDEASLRRFDLKIRFDPLHPDQRWRLLCALLCDLGAGEPPPELRAALDRLSSLTPGDFSTAMRQARLMGGTADPHRLVAALEAEARLKRGGARRGIGFDA